MHLPLHEETRLSYSGSLQCLHLYVYVNGHGVHYCLGQLWMLDFHYRSFPPLRLWKIIVICEMSKILSSKRLISNNSGTHVLIINSTDLVASAEMCECVPLS